VTGGEVWFWRANRLEVFVLRKSGQYERSERSVLLPHIDPRLLERCVAMNSWREARKILRASLSKRD
jgi:hypothetical protein